LASQVIGQEEGEKTEENGKKQENKRAARI